METLTLIGRLTADATFAQGADASKNRANFSLALGEGEKSHYYNVVAWGARANFIQGGLGMGLYKKGQRVVVVGTPSLNVYQSNDGKRKASINVTATSTECLADKGVSSQPQAVAGYQMQQAYVQTPVQQQYTQPQANAPAQQQTPAQGGYAQQSAPKPYTPPQGGFIPAGYPING